MLVRLGTKGIKTLDDLADLSTDELIGKGDKRREIQPGLLASFGISVDDGNAIIMAARKHWFEDEDAG
jgi:transcription termination/antitermination protein NusA